MAKAEIMDWGPGQHGTTFGGNPVACAAANATIDLLEQGMMENAATTGEYFKEKLKELAAKTPHIASPRGLGLMIAIDAVHDDGTPSSTLRNDMVMKFYDHGVLALGCGAHSIRFAPPLCINREQVDFVVETLGKICNELKDHRDKNPKHEDGVAS
jgi:4-aminobutyrate aminotransferase